MRFLSSGLSLSGREKKLRTDDDVVPAKRLTASTSSFRDGLAMSASPS
jgi:hypothetical protein